MSSPTFTLVAPDIAVSTGSAREPVLSDHEFDSDGVVKAIHALNPAFPDRLDEVKQFAAEAQPGNRLKLTKGHLSVIIFRNSE